MDEPAGLAALRKLPAVGTLLALPELAPLIERHGRALVTDAVRGALERARGRIRAGDPAPVTSQEVVASLAALERPSLRPVLNGTGVLLHTNLGRAPLAEAARAAVAAVAEGYSALELDVERGTRGTRHVHVSSLLADLLGCDGGAAFNNCAGAVLLMLAALCRGREVIVARGELVEIGGGFRVPDVMAESGATLVEVGTTNKVYARDYARAINERTGALLRVHRSNFALVGFTAEPELEELAAVAAEAKVPLLVDLGSGLLADAAALGPAAPLIAREPRPKDVLRRGAELVAFSGDKLLGGPQAGILAGRGALLDRVERHPLARALRADKLSLAALEATLRLYRDGRAQEIPVIRDLATPLEVVAARAEALRQRLAGRDGLAVEVIEGVSVPGGGSLPLVELPSRLVLVGPPGEPARALAQALRGSDPPLITRMVQDRVAIDPRTLREADIPVVVRLVENALGKTCVIGGEKS